MRYPRAFSHIGLSVPNIEKAVEFYTKAFGWYVIMKPTDVKEENESAIGIMCEDVFGAGYESFKIAHLATSDKIGIELFEFEKNEKPASNLEYNKHGIFHFCIQDPDIEGTLELIKELGGKQRMPIREYYPGDKPYRMVYVEDPFGNVFELYSHSYELNYSSGAYQD